MIEIEPAAVRSTAHAPGTASPGDARPSVTRSRVTRVQMLVDYLRDRPNVWIDGRELEFAGRYAWRNRVSDCRRPPYNMQIENRQRRRGSYVTSEYRFVPSQEA